MVCVNQEETNILSTLPSATRKVAFSLNRVRDTILWDIITTRLPVMTYRTNHIIQAAQNTLGCEFHLKWECPKVHCRSQCQFCLEGGPLILNLKEFPEISGQGKRIADHEQELKNKIKQNTRKRKWPAKTSNIRAICHVLLNYNT